MSECKFSILESYPPMYSDCRVHKGFAKFLDTPYCLVGAEEAIPEQVRAWEDELPRRHYENDSKDWIEGMSRDIYHLSHALNVVGDSDYASAERRKAAGEMQLLVKALALKWKEL